MLELLLRKRDGGGVVGDEGHAVGGEDGGLRGH